MTSSRCRNLGCVLAAPEPSHPSAARRRRALYLSTRIRGTVDRRRHAAGEVSRAEAGRSPPSRQHFSNSLADYETRSSI